MNEKSPIDSGCESSILQKFLCDMDGHWKGILHPEADTHKCDLSAMYLRSL